MWITALNFRNFRRFRYLIIMCTWKDPRILTLTIQTRISVLISRMGYLYNWHLRKGYQKYQRVRFDGGCCTGPQTFHERCYCNAGLDFCKAFCDEDDNCQGYVGEGTNVCQIATTSSCPTKECEKVSIGKIGSLDPNAKCGSIGLEGCFVKDTG